MDIKFTLSRICDKLKINMIRTEIKKLIQSAIKSHWDVDLELAEIKIDYPPEGFGDYSANAAMNLAKITKSNPTEIAEEIAGRLKKNDLFQKIEVVKPGFINFYLAPEVLWKSISEINEAGEDFGNLEKKKGKIMVEYSQPNTHKEFHVGHLRNVFIGSTLVNILKKAGYEVIQANYIGDTGTHIAKCLWALDKFHKNEDFGKIANKTEFLGKVYFEAVRAIEENSEYEKEFKDTQKKFEDNDKELTELWKKTRQWSLDEFGSIYKKLGVSFNVYFYESEEEIEGKKMVQELIKKGIAKESEGAVIVDLEKYDLGVLVLLRNDGSALYGIKDIPLAIKKFDDYKIDKSIIIADIRQDLYFQQIFKILSLLGFKKETTHVGYGFVFLKGGEGMSSRKGNIVPARELFSKVEEEIKNKFPQTPMPDEIGNGAIRFFMLKHSRGSNIEFDIAESVKIEAATGPYIQYAYARICSILNRFGVARGSARFGEKSGADFRLLLYKIELKLANQLIKFPEIIEDIVKDYQVHRLPHYALDLVRIFHKFYEECRVIDEENPDLTQARLSLVEATQIVLKSVLDLMGISAPEKM